MSPSRVLRGTFFLALLTTVAFSILFVHLDNRLSHGAFSSISSEIAITMSLAVANMMLWTVTWRLRVRENRMAVRARRRVQREEAERREAEVPCHAGVASLERLEAA